MAGPAVCMGAQLMCTSGVAPSVLTVTSNPIVSVNGMFVATIMDMAPVANIPPFGTCNVLTAAALGVPTPCVPAPVGPWTPGSTIQSINGLKVLTQSDSLVCGIGGKISIVNPGQTIETTM